MSRLLVLANRDYEGWGDDRSGHMTDEGAQLQRGLEAAGWTLAGYGYGDGCKAVPGLLATHRPEAVFVQDPRDWDRDSAGTFDVRVSFDGAEILAEHPEIYRVGVLKDAACCPEFQAAWLRRLRLDAFVTYYHDAAVRRCAPWAAGVELIRGYHSVDGESCAELAGNTNRKRAIVTGAVSYVYPLRTAVMAKAGQLGIDIARHPGYSNHGSCTPAYLHMLSGYRVHVATASMYGFALRKIIESVAVGCTPVTNLPAEDVLPEIDGALWRVSPEATVEEVAAAVKAADAAWSQDAAADWAKRAIAFYDWRASGVRLGAKILERMEARRG